MLTSCLKRRPLVCYASGSLCDWTNFVSGGDALLCFCTMFKALPQWAISLHVFGEDTVANVTVSRANLCGCFRWALPRSLLLCCFDLRRNANLAGGFVGRFCFSVVLLVFVSFRFNDDLPFSRTTRVHVQNCFSLLTQL